MPSLEPQPGLTHVHGAGWWAMVFCAGLVLLLGVFRLDTIPLLASVSVLMLIPVISALRFWVASRA
jgi:hypothetical protein